MTTKTLKGPTMDDESKILHDDEGNTYRIISKREFRGMMRTLFFDVVLRRSPVEQPENTTEAALPGADSNNNQK